MAKNHQSDNPLFKALVKRYEADIASAFATLIVYFDSSVGIGEHPDVIDAIHSQVLKIASAEENIQVLQQHFVDQKVI